MLRIVEDFNIRIDLALFDRAFYIGHLIDFLEAEKINYLILVPENERMKFFAEHTEAIRAFKHTVPYKKSNEHIIRYFYFMVQLLLHVAWNATKKLVEQVSFKRYLIKLIGDFRLLLEQGIT